MKLILERQEDGSYAMTEETAKAEMRQEFTAEEIARLVTIKNDKTANMESSGFLGGIGTTLDKVTGMEIMEIPIGQAAIGGALAILLDRVVIARLDPKNTWGSWANLGLAFAIKKFGSKFIGNKTADAAALILTYEAIADWVTQGINTIIPPITTPKQVFHQAAPSGGVMHQANQVAENYYASAFGG